MMEAEEARTKRKRDGLDDEDTNSSKTPGATPINNLEEAHRQGHLIYKKTCALISLLYYNVHNDTKFELVVVENMDSYAFTDFSGSWIHCSFNAKDANFRITKFYAELQYVHPSGPVVTSCMILEGETKVGCQYCKSVTHPVVRYPGEEEDSGNETPASSTHEDEAFSIRSPDYPDWPEPDSETLRERHRKKWAESSNLALDYYNLKNHTKYKLVEDNDAMDCKCILVFSSYWIHCCFDAVEDSSIKNFFAEIKYPLPPVVTTCQILEEGETKFGCSYCDFIHPIDGYQARCLTTDPLVARDHVEELVTKHEDSGSPN